MFSKWSYIMLILETVHILYTSVRIMLSLKHFAWNTCYNQITFNIRFVLYWQASFLLARIAMTHVSTSNQIVSRNRSLWLSYWLNHVKHVCNSKSKKIRIFTYNNTILPFIDIFKYKFKNYYFYSKKATKWQNMQSLLILNLIYLHQKRIRKLIGQKKTGLFYWKKSQSKFMAEIYFWKDTDVAVKYSEL